MALNLFDLAAKISLDSSEYTDGLKKCESDGRRTSSRMSKAFRTIAGVSAAALGAATAAVVGFGASSVKAGMEFDVSMSQVAATMGKTVDEIQDLRDFAQEMGSKTAFSATQAADALNYMALAGYDSETSMKMLPNVLNLAAAGSIDLARASDMVTDAQSALGLSLDETSELVDKMAKASSKSNTSVEQLGDAMLTIGGTAKVLAGGTTELSAALGILADNGIKGAEGGTQLRNVLLGIQSSKFDKSFGALGVQAYDANGNLRNMSDILADMSAVMDGMTSEQKTELISQAFNRQDLKAVNALLATSTDRWKELSAAIDNSTGAAEQMAATQLDNLTGDITLFKSALEGAQIAVSDKLTPTLREFVQLGTGGLSKVTDAFREGGLESAFGAFGEFLTDAITKIVTYIPTIVKAGVSLLKAFLRGILDNAPLIISAAFEIITTLGSSLVEDIPTLLPAIVDVITGIAEAMTDPENISTMVETAIALLIALADGFIAGIDKLIDKAPVILSNLKTALEENAPKLKEAADLLMSKFGDWIKEKFELLRDKGREIIAEIKAGVQEKIDDAKKWGEDLIEGFINGIKEKWDNLKQKVSNVVSSVKSLFTGKNGFDEHSPSKWARDVFENVLVGAERGLDIGESGLVKQTESVVRNVQDEFDNSYTGTSSKIADEILAVLRQYLPQMANMDVKLDTGALVGELTPGIDAQLGTRQGYAMRGAAVV